MVVVVVAHKKFQHRTLEAIKCHRRQEVYRKYFRIDEKRKRMTLQKILLT